METDQSREGKMPEIEKFVEYLGGIWEKTSNMPWMEEAKRLLGEKITVINEFNIDTEQLTKEINKRKSWIAPGINEVQTCWWKKLVVDQKYLLSPFKRIIYDNSKIHK